MQKTIRGCSVHVVSICDVRNQEDQMKELRCKDLKKGCRYVARGRTIRSIMKKIKKHARMKHEIERISAAMTRKARVAIHAV